MNYRFNVRFRVSHLNHWQRFPSPSLIETVRDRTTTTDIAETLADGDNDDEECNTEELVSENDTVDEDWEGGGGEGTGSEFKRRQTRSFYFTTGAVKRIESKEDSALTVICQVGGHAECSNIIPMTKKALY